MSRTRKLLIVSVVLALGIGLALPFRKKAVEDQPAATTGTEQFALSDNSAPQQIVEQSRSTSLAQVQAKMTSMGEAKQPVTSRMNRSGFDLVNHPAAQRGLPQAKQRPVAMQPVRQQAQYRPAASQPRPTYETIGGLDSSEAEWPREVVHVVSDGDTLEKLAQRYLGDEARALEIFELNRNTLVNPHQLPIEAELRIPVAPDKIID